MLKGKSINSERGMGYSRYESGFKWACFVGIKRLEYWLSYPFRVTWFLLLPNPIASGVLQILEKRCVTTTLQLLKVQ